ncbi:MAG: hydantoinase/oxoprolinase family protein [Nitrososphaerales archaeon]|nr:hydantoinase/oxoprolinase family protein [Nitrososphaerales archaeon]
MGIRVAIDVGGTFTDLCALDEKTGAFIFVKDSTTPENFANGVIKVVKKGGLRGEEIDRFIGTGSTMVINALTEGKGAKTLLLTTRGFRDVLEIQRSNRTDLYNFRYAKPKPLVPRRLRFEVDERISSDGRVLRQLNSDDVMKAADACRKEGAEAIAVALYNSYANPQHELDCFSVLSRETGASITMSHELTREWREYERTNTAVMNAFVQPKVAQYLTTLEEEMRKLGVRIRMHVMQSNGGVSTFDQAKRTPIYQVESGPIGGVIGALKVGREMHEANIISLDVGGTTAKTSLIDSGRFKINTEYNIGRNEFFAGYPVKVPVVDIVEIGAGGGSVAWVDELGSMKVGPMSAGADPGPACYGKGGTEPTITDAFVLTGIIDPDYFLGGEIRLKRGLAEKAFRKVANRLELDVVDAARGAIRLATANMVNAMKLVSIRRGYDPRDFVLVAFGGGGPMFASSLAKELGTRKVVIPRVPGVFSAWGMLMTDLRHDYVRTKVTKLDVEGLNELQSISEEMSRAAYKQLYEEGVKKDSIWFEAIFDIRYLGQEHTVPTPIPIGTRGRGALEKIAKRFRKLHMKQYTFTLSDPLEVVNVHLSAFGRVVKPRMKPWKAPKKLSPPKERKAVVDQSGLRRIKAYERDWLKVGTVLRGPAVIEEPTSTTILQTGDRLKVDKFGNLILEVA